MRTFILMWNPDISAMKMLEFEKCIKSPSSTLTWNVWDHELVDYEDRFYMVRVGEGPTGIVMSGEFYGKTEKGEDWSGKGRETYYAELEIESIFHPECEPIITTGRLQEEIPDFDWTGGHSGRVLTDEQAEKLEVLFMEFVLQRYATIGHADEWGYIYTPSAYISPNVFEPSDCLLKYLRRTRGESCVLCGYNYQEKFGADNPYHNDYILIGEPLKGLHLSNFHCLCPSCERMEEEIELLIKSINSKVAP